ncbi:hypothetical protein K504DRAFT_506404 [Pleomassaria siparia CBS 279.74]|uniref:Uncharacterized protein n=1 Tax=Pleomassaria siparia CBS 279.74 TaxID=1314801 RepID=A0A6G1JWR5_9PLEO|nr:hypothetical protein K504DRAFT_506404 [Pleomassaria siparia CBS 279.74]
MSPSSLLPESSFSVTPLADVPGKKHNFGAVIEAVDYPESKGTRTMHQANIGASRGPIHTRKQQFPIGNQPRQRADNCSLHWSDITKSFCSGRSHASTTTPPGAGEPSTEYRLDDQGNKPSHTYTNTPSLVHGALDSLISSDLGNDTTKFLGLEGATPFDNLLYLANHDFT